MKPFGVATSVTEMTSVIGIVYRMGRTAPYIEFESNGPTGVQLFGHDLEVFTEAAGKALEHNPEIAFFRHQHGVPRGQGDTQPGWFVLHEGAFDMRGGAPRYDLVEGSRKGMYVPLVISGNIYFFDDTIDMAKVTGAESVIVVRRVGDPFLVIQIDRFFHTGERMENSTVSQQIAWCKELSGAIIAESGEEVTVRRLHTYASKFVTDCHRCRGYRKRLATGTVGRESLFFMLDDADSKMGSERIFSEGYKEHSCRISCSSDRDRPLCGAASEDLLGLGGNYLLLSAHVGP